MKRKITVIFVCMLVIASSRVVLADWEPGDGHKMHWPQTPKQGGWDIEFSVRLADDWRCSETGPVTDIHFWVSWMQDNPQPIENFSVTIWSDWPADDPTNPYDYSVPRDPLWYRDIYPADFTLNPQEPDTQDWFDPSSGGWMLNDHTLWDQVNIDSIPDPFIQQQDSIYWLEIDFWGLPFAGWKETDQNWNDDAVFWYFPDWFELRDPITGGTIDLAFVITGEPLEPPDYFKACYDSNYAPAGMPDFDQKQDNWKHPTSGNWSFCGPTALANCLWWIDSRFEHWLARVNGGPIGFPGDQQDRFPLVRDYTDNLAQAYVPPNPPWGGTNHDDHAADNVDNPVTIWQRPGAPPGPYSSFTPGLQPVPQYPLWGELIERLAWCCDCDGSQSGGGWEGTYVSDMQECIDTLLVTEGLDTLLYEHTEEAYCNYEFDQFIREQIYKSQDVILLIGYWYFDGYDWWREGGHYVTVAGVGIDPLGGTILAISDPFYDNAEPPPQGTGGPGCVHNSIYQGHPTPHNSSLHNDAGNASHDWYHMVPTEPDHWDFHFMLEGYPPGYKKEFLDNFYGQNVPRELEKYQDVRRREYKEKQLHTLIEFAVVVSPYPDYSDVDPYPEADHSDWTEEWLGESVSADTAARLWDEDTYDDGVTFFTPYDSVGAEESLQVTISVRDRYACEAHGGRYDADHLLYLHGWIDWNVDGDFDDANENIFSGVEFDPSTWSSDSYTYTHIFIVPDGAVAGTTCTRFRLDYNQNLNDPAGQAYCGEVEDYCNELIIVSVPGEQGALNVPQTFALEQNYPNPFNLKTAIRYQIPEDCWVTLEIYNLLGQKVRTLFNDKKRANYYTVYWDGNNAEGKEVTSGIYFCTLRAGTFTQTRRMLILK